MRFLAPLYGTICCVFLLFARGVSYADRPFTKVHVRFEQDGCEFLNRWRLYASTTNDPETAVQFGYFTRQLDDPDRLECAETMEKTVTTTDPFEYGTYFWLQACTSPSIDDCSVLSSSMLLAGCHGG